MRAMIRPILRDERGTTMISWVGMTVCVFVIVIGIWGALYGGAGRSLKATVQGEVHRFANGFEGGLGSSGAPGRMPQLGQPELVNIDQPIIDQPTIYTPTISWPIVPPVTIGEAIVPPVTIGQPVVDQPVVVAPAVAVLSIPRLLPPTTPIPTALGIPRLLLPDTPLPPAPVIGLAILAVIAALLRTRLERVAEMVRDLLPGLLRAGTDERGVNIVEYVGVTGIALMVAGFMIVGVSAYRFRIGGSMGAVLDNQIASFENGRGGTVNYNTRLWRIGEPNVSQPEQVQIGRPEPIIQPQPRLVRVDTPFVPALGIPAVVPFFTPSPDSPAPDTPSPDTPSPNTPMPDSPLIPTIGIGVLGLTAALLARRTTRRRIARQR